MLASGRHGPISGGCLAVRSSARGGFSRSAPRLDRLDDPRVDRGHRAIDRAETLPRHHEHPHRRLGGDRRHPALLADQRHLAEEVAGTELGEPGVAANDLGRPVDDHEELVTEISLAREALALRNVEFVRLLRDLGQLTL